MTMLLEGLTVVELAHEMTAWAGKLLADAGARVVLVEPLGGSKMRTFPPFYRDQEGPDTSLYFWHYQTNKRSIILDLQDAGDQGLLRSILTSADILLEAERPGALGPLGLGYEGLHAANPRLVHVSITPYGQHGLDAPATDLTILAEGGPVWSCGYDDHTIPPVRGGGNQGYQTAGHMAVMSCLTALLYRGVSGRGQHIDVSAVAASNVTTEMGSYEWLIAKGTVQRQTGRHATSMPSSPVQVQCKDGRYINLSVPPRTPAQFRVIRDWLDSYGWLAEFPLAAVLDLAAEGDRISAFAADDPEIMMKMEAGREAMLFIAERLPAYEYFVEAQARNFQIGIVYAPEEAIEDEHTIARGFPVTVDHPELGQQFTYPGSPYKFPPGLWGIRRRAPLLGEDTESIRREFGASV